MSTNTLKEHGQAIMETAKDHLVAALQNAPDDGWTAVEWAQAAGLLLDGANFPAVLTHHVAPVLVGEGRARVVGEGGLARYSSVQEAHEESHSVMAAATSAPQVWDTSPEGAETAEVLQGSFPEGTADEEAEGPPDGHDGPWIP